MAGTLPVWIWRRKLTICIWHHDVLILNGFIFIKEYVVIGIGSSPFFQGEILKFFTSNLLINLLANFKVTLETKMQLLLMISLSSFWSIFYLLSLMCQLICYKSDNSFNKYLVSWDVWRFIPDYKTKLNIYLVEKLW